MSIYIFKNNKRTSKKKIIKKLGDSEEAEARNICQEHNRKKSPYWLEYSRDKERAR